MNSESEDFYQLIYFSSAKAELTEAALRKLLARSQSRNSKKGITGLLLHSGGNIIQIIEGEKSKVEDLFLKIQSDPRHKNVTAVSRSFSKERDFPHYSMGFKRVGKQLAEKEVPGFTDIIEKGHIPQDTLKDVSKHIRVFLQSFARVTRIDNH